MPDLHQKFLTTNKWGPPVLTASVLFEMPAGACFYTVLHFLCVILGVQMTFCLQNRFLNDKVTIHSI
jgi:hypothetical protein